MPIDLWAKWSGSGFVPDGKAAWAAVGKLMPEERVHIEVSKPRNASRHKLYFAVIERAYENWGDLHEFTPSSSEHLRHWLQIKAGHRNAESHEVLPTADVAVAARVIVEAAMKHKFPFIRSKGNKVTIYTSKSIDYASLDEAAFKPILDSVFSVIEAELGVPIEKLKAEVAMGEAA